MPHRLVLVLVLVLVLEGCKKDPPGDASTTTSSSAPVAASSSSAAPHVVAESLPRCRAEGARLAIPGDDVVVGDAIVTPDALYVGVVRREGTKRLASVVKAALDLSSSKTIEVAPSVGDDPPPTPRLAKGAPVVTFLSRKTGDAGPDSSRILQFARIEGDAVGKVQASIAQQADESLAYDVAWPAEGEAPPLATWDEDAPPSTDTTKVPVVGLPDRGVVKVRVAVDGTKSRVASPETSDAESPRLLARKGGFWLAWLARKPEPREDGGIRAEAPGEHRVFRWVEIVALDAKGEAVSPVRRVSPERGRVVAFELARNTGEEIVVLVQDEAARAEGGGERLVRYAVEGEKADKIEGSDLVDAGVGQALAELVHAPLASTPPYRWLAFADVHERMHLVPLAASVRSAGTATAEPALDGARVLASGSGDVVFAAGGAASEAGGRIELRRLVCR